MRGQAAARRGVAVAPGAERLSAVGSMGAQAGEAARQRNTTAERQRERARRGSFLCHLVVVQSIHPVSKY